MLAHRLVPAHQAEQGRTPIRIGDIFRRFGPAYRQQFGVTDAQAKVMRAIETCRTPALGGHRRVCEDCGVMVDEFNSCRNRHCPTCQALPQAKWIAKRQQRVLPVRHFHVVFTLPAQLRPIAHLNREIVFALLLRVAADTLLTLGSDPKRLGVQLGITAVLHTWTRDLQFHPHVHCVVTAGGMATQGLPRWIHVSGDFLFPVQVISRLFRGKFLAGLQDIHDAGKLILPHDPHPDVTFQQLKDELYEIDWNVYCKQTFGRADHVFSYLGRYTHRVAISNQRLISYDDDGVCFATKDGKFTSIPPLEFIRRFLMHVLPHAFVKIRHYGLMASANVNGRLEIARFLLTPVTAANQDIKPAETSITELPWEHVLLRLTGIDLRTCPECGSTNVKRYPIPLSRSPPLDTS